MIKKTPKTAAIAKKQRRQSGNFFNRYDAARRSDYVQEPFGINPNGANADSHYENQYDFYRMAEVALDLYRNNAIVAPTVDRLVSNILQQGFQLEPHAGRRTANDQLQEKWNEFSENKKLCDVQQEFDFTALSTMALRDSIVAGDIVGLPLKSGQLQMIESHRIRTPVNVRDRSIVHGVELDAQRRRINYWITHDNISLNDIVYLSDTSPFRVYDAKGHKQLFHVWHPARSTQTRGVSKLVPCMDYVKMLGDVHFARLVQQQAVSAYTWVRERDFGFETPENVENRQEYDPASGTYRNLEDVSVGSEYTTFPGEHLKALNSNVPNPTFFDHVQAIEQLIGLNLDLPLIVMKLDASETNFSGWRGALEQAKLKFRYFQGWFANCTWYRPIYEFKLRQWTNPASEVYDESLAELRRSIGDTKFFAHEWIPPGWPYINPAEDQEADANALANGLSSHRRVHRNRGGNWNRVYPEIIEDRSLAIEAAIKKAAALNKKYGPDVNPIQIKWSDLITMPRPKGENVSEAREPEDASSDQPGLERDPNLR